MAAVVRGVVCASPMELPCKELQLAKDASLLVVSKGRDELNPLA